MKKAYKLFRIKMSRMAKSIFRMFMVKRRKANKRKRTQVVRKAERTAAELEYRLQNLGFIERALDDLQIIINSDKKKYQKRPAARVLATWYANQRDEVGARQCLDILAIVKEGEKDRKRIKEIAIMEAECYDMLGNIEDGKNAINRALEHGPDAELYLAAANFEGLIPDRLELINKAFVLNNVSKISYDPAYGSTSFDSLRFGNSDQIEKLLPSGTYPMVTVIITVYNAENTIKTAIDSVLAQTWKNLEVLIVDDCSNDGTLELVEGYRNVDERLHLIKAKKNSGPYVARNLAFREATGVFVTCHDADDWSHPQKIEKQAIHLMQNPEVMGNTSQHIRMTTDLKVYRRGKFGKVILENVSSFMFRREPIINKIGYWDCVRFRADAEFIRRIRKVFGNKSVVNLNTGPLSFLRQHDISLTGDKYFGMHGYLMGARKHYVELQKYFHEKANSLYYEFPQLSRPFPVPEPMWPQREVTGSRRRHFDLILASDFRLAGGTTSSNIEEIKAQKEMGLRTGLFQMSRYALRADLKNINSKILEMLDGEQVQMLVYGEKVTCGCLVIRHPPVLQERQLFIPDVKANNVIVIANQTPQRDYGKDSSIEYEIERCQSMLFNYFDQAGVWYPNGPMIREVLLNNHAKEIEKINLAEEDWVGIVNVDDWRREDHLRQGSNIRIGRHSRDRNLKWPDSREQLLSIYPDNNRYEIHVLGGAEAPKKILGQLPDNWCVFEFDEISPKEFLASLDVFVYFTHPDMVEAFGRVIAEAMAVGVPVVIPPIFRKQFGDAAIYSEPAAVKTAIERLVGDEQAYRLQVEKGHEFVEKNFGYSKHALRIKKLISSP